jgi:hypothetical protein
MSTMEHAKLLIHRDGEFTQTWMNTISLRIAAFASI